MRGLHAVALLTLGAALAAGYAVYGQDSPRYITAPVERGSVATIVKATGTVDAVLTVDVGSQLSGRIADVFVDFNDQVKAGQPIARLDTELFAARVSEAEAALKVAEATARVQKAAVERARLATLNAVLARGAAEFGFTSVKPDFTGHQLCTTQPYVQGLGDAAPFHPTAMGQLDIALADQAALNSPHLPGSSAVATPSATPTPTVSGTASVSGTRSPPATSGP